MANAFLEKQKATQRAYFEAGLQSGRQQIMDMMSLVLRDSDIDQHGLVRMLLLGGRFTFRRWMEVDEDA